MEFRHQAYLSICVFIVAATSHFAHGFQLRAASEEVPTQSLNKRSQDSGTETEEDLPGVEGASPVNKWAGRLKLHMMENKGLHHDGAVCLDGSDTGFYFAPALKQEDSDKWQIIFEGGGWCLHEEMCIPRLDSGLGSSKTWTHTYGRRTLEGFLSDDCGVNPEFCTFNRVLVPYCDGASFTGDRDEPSRAKDHLGMPVKMYFRGRRNLIATFDTLFEEFGLQKATHVILTGWSAGGLTSMLYGDYVHDRLRKSAPNLEKFRVVPISSLFLETTPRGKESKVFHTELLNMFEFANSTGSFSPECVKHFKSDFRKCGLAPHAYEYLEAETFILNSGVDQWQLAFVLADEKILDAVTLPEVGDLQEFETGFKEDDPSPTDEWVWTNTRCMADGDCGKNEIDAFHQFQDNIEDLLAKAASKKGHGAFIHSCPSHTEALSNMWSEVVVNKVSMQQAVLNWWYSDGNDPSKKHTTRDCHLRDQPPYACNPSCPEMRIQENQA